ncbi:hypothetical protein [Echinicola rosea]|uniref:Uncharacterized protein n=1 Tax=Echinicola rosea TaxID=1807691 RepID=A0ABQ1UTF8_9BACT|nr:hypothetical protein [Echinicola rosea]GGF26717.1 hypothetical protein GCM10011339_13560 [Echinicola rosea]
MDSVKVERREKARIYLMKYNFDPCLAITSIRLIVGPELLFWGFYIYSNAMGRFRIGYGGVTIAFAVNYTFKPF